MTFPKDFRSPGEFSHPGTCRWADGSHAGGCAVPNSCRDLLPPFRIIPAPPELSSAWPPLRPSVACCRPPRPAAIFAAALPRSARLSAPDAAARPRLSSPPLFPCSPCSPAPILPRLSATPTLLSALFSHSRCSFTASVALPFRLLPRRFPAPVADRRT